MKYSGTFTGEIELSVDDLSQEIVDAVAEQAYGEINVFVDPCDGSIVLGTPFISSFDFKLRYFLLSNLIAEVVAGNDNLDALRNELEKSLSLVLMKEKEGGL